MSIVVLTACTQASLLRPLLALKLRGYLTKSDTGQELVNALFAAAKPGGATIIAASLTNLLLADQGEENDFAQRRATLNPREQVIVALMLEGKTNQQIAEALAVNVQTVRNYVSLIYGKLGVNSRTALLLLANRANRG